MYWTGGSFKRAELVSEKFENWKFDKCSVYIHCTFSPMFWISFSDPDSEGENLGLIVKTVPQSVHNWETEAIKPHETLQIVPLKSLFFRYLSVICCTNSNQCHQHTLIQYSSFTHHNNRQTAAINAWNTPKLHLIIIWNEFSTDVSSEQVAKSYLVSCIHQDTRKQAPFQMCLSLFIKGINN